MKNKAFILSNEQKSNITTSKILFISCIISFPLLLLLNFLHIFNINWTSLIILSVVGILLSFIPFILVRLKANSSFIKYSIVIISTVIIGILAVNPKIGIYLLYMFPVALSCLYFDKKLTITTLIVGIPNLIISQYFHITVLHPGSANVITDTYIPILAGLLIEFISLSLIFIMLTNRTRNLLENLVGAEEQEKLLLNLKEIMDKSSEASSVLASSMSQLTASMDETTENNITIASNAQEVTQGSAKNLSFIENTSSTVEKISSSLESIAFQSKELVSISDKNVSATVESKNNISSAIESMKIIETSSYENKDMMNRLGETSEQIGSIVELISNITKQTNLLALNAAIESARAGEQGKGFAVVAEQIRKLAEQSASSAQDITSLITNIQKDTKNAITSIDEGAATIRTGIEQVRFAGKSFEELKALQEEANNKIQAISVSSNEISDLGNSLKQIISSIREQTNDLLLKLQAISASTEQQSSAMSEISASFDNLDKITKDLLELSNSINANKLQS